uniref:Apple domain-containing protein n=1 Tax=Tetranychus urticae TaxID=32264 RepID=T1K276_TETUR
MQKQTNSQTLLIFSKEICKLKREANNHFVLDINKQYLTDQELDKIVPPTPGIGCPIYLTHGLPKQFSAVPLITKNQIHFISIERGSEKSVTMNEIFGDETNQIASLKTRNQGGESTTIIDYTLGIVYSLIGDHICTIQPADLSTLGISVDDRRFGLAALLGTNILYKYLGQVFYKKRTGFQVDVWEAVEFGKTIDKKKYDKIVTTQYFVPTYAKESMFGYIPVGTVTNFYNQVSSSHYQLTESKYKEYHDFGLEIADAEYESRFQVNRCYPKPESRKTLAFHFTCKDDYCDPNANEKYYEILDRIKGAIIRQDSISSSRISNIDLEFSANKDSEIIAYITFLEAPTIEYSFKSKEFYLTKSLIQKSRNFYAENDEDCFKKNANVADKFEAIAYCAGTKTCVRITSINDIEENWDHGSFCRVTYIPLRNFKRFNHELPLDKIQDSLGSSKISFNYITGLKSMQYQLSQIIETISRKQENGEDLRLFYPVYRQYKLIDNRDHVLVSSEVKNLGDCARSCLHSVDNKCATFAFCTYPDRMECLTSTIPSLNMSDQQQSFDASCSIYSVNNLKDYIKIPNRKFISASTIQTLSPKSHCASLCSSNEQCKSFQFCFDDYSCIFNGPYTDSASQYSTTCDIYIPDVTQKYSFTGKKIVSETFHTELNLTLNQCAALCHDWNTIDEICQSFNYCPKSKTESSCNLSKYSVKDSAAETTESNICHNYIKTEDRNVKKQPYKAVKDSNNLNVFVFIVLFFALGLMTGFGTPFIYTKIKSLISPSQGDEVPLEMKKSEINEEGDEITPV